MKFILGSIPNGAGTMVLWFLWSLICYLTLAMSRIAKSQDSRQAGSQQPISGKSLEENNLDIRFQASLYYFSNGKLCHHPILSPFLRSQLATSSLQSS